jgi:TPR repeat protein
MKTLIYVMVLAGLLGACSNKENAVASQVDMNAARARLTFACVREVDHLPPLAPEADQLFKYGLFLERHLGPKDYSAVARYYRIAAAYGHYKANNNLQLLVSTGLASSPDAHKETIDLAEKLIGAGVPGGYYDMGHYLELGYGVVKDEKKALVFIRKAADMGSPEAQAYVAKLLAPADRAPEIATQMRQCAAQQGNADAANDLGVHWQDNGSFSEAVQIFQMGIKAGSALSVSYLKAGFGGPAKTNELDYLGLEHDAERVRRYDAIGKFLDANDGRNPKVPDIDQIVPLPPAKLPPWDGTFQWQKEQDAAQPPQKPAEALVTKLAREKNLDPATGLPVAPAKSAKDERVPLGTVARTGQVCPQDGLWTVQRFADVSCDATRRFRKGETMPQLALNDPRPIPGLDWLLGMRKYRSDREWTLKAYIDQA